MTPTGAMSAGRARFPAVKLGSGKVLVMGGMTPAGITSGAELFDPATGAFTATSAMSMGRYGHAAARLPDGSVLVTGGAGVDYPATLPDEIYEPATGTWTKAGSDVERQAPALAVLNDGRVLIAGGLGGTSMLNTARIFDPATRTASATGSLSYARYEHTATTLNDGRVLVAGGRSGSAVLSSAEIYNPATGKWSTTGSLREARASHVAVKLPSGKVLVAGGITPISQTAEIYDPATGQWSFTGSMTTLLWPQAAFLTSTGNVLVFTNSYPSGTTAVQSYDPVAATWTALEILTPGRQRFGAVALDGGGYLLAGGNDSAGGYLDTGVLYTDPGCVPTTCAALGSTCGSIPDGCGGTLQCGTCGGGGEVCSTSHACCTPAVSCEALGKNCGAAADGCGGQLSCGTCGAGQVCSDNVCIVDDTRATYDPALGAPRCPGEGPACDSGVLLQGRGPLGPEPNGPNTIHGSCADGAAGTYHLDQSLEVLRISSVAQRNLAYGEQVKVEALVWGYPYYQGDMLDLYSAADAEHPAWKLIATVPLSASGAHTLSATYTLPWGGLQAVRGVVRHDVAPGACPGGQFTDVDDLIFPVRLPPDLAPPSTSITSPLAGESVSGSRTINATASDDNGVTRVEFYDGDVLLGTAAAAPYSSYWYTRGLANGPHTLTTRAYDLAGKVGISDPVVVDVQNDYTPPTVAITTPVAGAVVAQQVSVTVQAADAAGVGTVELLLDGKRLLVDSSAPYEFRSVYVGDVSNGDHTLTARAYDTQGNSALSAPVVVTVNNDVAPPTVSIAAPAAGSVVSGTVVLSAAASDDVGVTRVEFYEGTTYLGMRSAAPYQWSWDSTLRADGSRTFSAKAFDAAGNSATSPTVTVTVKNDNSPPYTYLASPISGAMLRGAATLTAYASDNSGVVRVEFYDNGSLVGTSTGAPYTLLWNTLLVANGSHSLATRAYDLSGNVGTSPAVTVTISNDTAAPTTSMTSPLAGAVLSGTVTLTAVASDNVGVTRVDFYDGASLLGSRTASPYTLSWDTTTATEGSHSLTTRAYDAAGNVGVGAAVAVTVGNLSTSGPLAVYDAARRAPACSAVGASCDSGSLLVGRGTRGPEKNAPNTIDSCADGAGGTYHGDESLDRLKIVSVDGTSLVPGKQVRIEATVWAYSSYTSDKLDLYYATDASAPVWTYLTTITPGGAGAQTLTATYTLPAGAQQAIRGVFRYGGSTGSCVPGSYNDHDDLVFATQ